MYTAVTTPAEIRPTFPVIPSLNDLPMAIKLIQQLGDTVDKSNLQKNNF